MSISLVKKPHILFTTEQPRHPTTGPQMSRDEALEYLRRRGIKALPTRGCYTEVPEPSIMVSSSAPGVERFIADLARRHGQDSIITSDGNKHFNRYLNGPDAGKAHEGEGTDFFTSPPTDGRGYTAFEDGTGFSHRIDWDSPPK